MKIKIFQIESEIGNRKIMKITIKSVGYLKHIKRSQVYMTEISNSNGKKSYDQFSPYICQNILFSRDLKEREKHVRLFDPHFNPCLSYTNSIIFYNPDNGLYYINFNNEWYLESSLDEIKRCYKNLLFDWVDF